MAIFGKKRSVNNSAASILPPMPQETIIHNHSQNWTAIIFSLFVCAVVLLPILWFTLVFLADVAGFVQPERTVAQLLFWIPLGVLAGWLLKWTLTNYFDRRYQYLEMCEQQHTERERIRLLSAQTAIDPGRMTEADFQFAQVVLGVMTMSYDEDGSPKQFKGRGRPWSVRTVLAIAKELKINMSQDRAGEVSRWLRKHNVVRGELEGQLNMMKFPNLGKVRELLDKEYGKPIVISAARPLRENSGFEHI